MVQTHVCWRDWQEFYVLCPNCASEYGKQWTGETGDDYSATRKRYLWNYTHNAAREYKTCERCQCELSGDVYQKTFNPDPSPESDSHIFNPEELTIPPIDFDEMDDVAIAQWIANMNPLEADIAPWTAFVIFRSGQIIKQQMETDEVVENIEYALANMLIISDVMLAHIEMTHGDFFEFLTQHGDRHVGVRDCLKEVVNNEPTERN